MGCFDVSHCYEDVDLTIEWGGEEDDLNMQRVLKVEVNSGSEVFTLPVDHPIVDMLILHYEEDMLRDAEGVLDELKPRLFGSSNGFY